MKNEQADWYTQQRRAFPASMNNATAFTRTGTPDNKRHGGPGTRSKNAARYDRIGQGRRDAAAN